MNTQTETIVCSCGRSWRMPLREPGVFLDDAIPAIAARHLNNNPHHRITALPEKFRVIVTQDSTGARTFGIRQPGCTYLFLATCQMRGHRSCSNHGSHSRAMSIARLRASNARATNTNWK